MSMIEYAPKTERLHRENRSVNGYWPVGIDYGFSAVKGFSPNKVFCFPNCAIQQKNDESILDPDDTDIIIRDKEGTWIIGQKAAQAMDSSDSMNYESEMYGRTRYATPVFRALIKAGLGVAHSANRYKKYQDEEIVVQTGLPPKYKDQDTDLIREAISGKYNFEMKMGKAPFQRYIFSVSEGNIFVMDQPMGSLLSSITDNNAVQKKSDYSILKSNTLIFDAGFKTLDTYNISAGIFKGSNTFDNLGMHEIFLRTAAELRRVHRSGITVPEMQTAIRRGYVNSFDRKTMANKRIEFQDILLKHSDAVCEEAVQKILSIYDYLQNHDYLVITGGTGSAWFPFIQERLKNMETLELVSANKNDVTISNVYSNVRGYYYYLVGYLERHRR